MAQPGDIRVNKWTLKNHRSLTRETILAVFDELAAYIGGVGVGRVLSSADEAYALASRFRGALYRYPFFKKKHLRILRAIVDRCGEAYHYKDQSRLYIDKNVVRDWSTVFQIPINRIQEYLRPLQIFKILEHSSDPKYIYRVSDDFFRLVGPAAQHIVSPTDPRGFSEMMAVVSGLSGIYVAVVGVGRGAGKPLAPWFLRLPMIYTLSGLEHGSMRIRDVLEIPRINYVDNYFVIERGAPVELWRSIRTEAFEFMADNNIIDHTTHNGYKLNSLWVRIHEEGVRRYVNRVRERYERRYRGY